MNPLFFYATTALACPTCMTGSNNKGLFLLGFFFLIPFLVAGLVIILILRHQRQEKKP